MTNWEGVSGYQYQNAKLNHSHAYLLPKVEEVLQRHFITHRGARRVFDLGCGNGSTAVWLSERGYEVTGVDPSSEGIAAATQAAPQLKLEIGSAYDDLPMRYGTFPSVISLEVVEHVYAPRQFTATMFDLLQPSGIALLSTPYHGYFKNLAIAVSGSFDRHVNPLWDHGHIKFWSFATLSELLSEAGFVDIHFHRVGRIPVLAKSMIAVARKPA